MSTLIQTTWAVKFAGVSIPFSTQAEARRFIKTNQKDIADRRGGTFKAVIVRISTPDTKKEAIH